MRISNGVRWLVLATAALMLAGCLGGGGNRTAYYSVSGTVTDEALAPIPEVVVSSAGKVDKSTTTDGSGNYQLTQLRGENTISARKEGWIFLYSAVVSSEQVVDFRGQRMSFPLSISVRGCGSVREQVVSALGSTTEYPFETVVELEAVPAEGWTFSHWEGSLTGSRNPAELVIAGPAAVTAVFTQGFATLTGTIEVRHIFSGPLHEGGTIAGPAAAHPAGSQWVEDWGELESDSDELVIGLDPDLDPAEGRQLLEELGFEVLDTLPVIGAYLVKHRVDGEIQALAAELRGYPIRYVQPNGTVRAMGPVEPSDPLFRRQWHYKLIRLPLAWSAITGSPAVRIAVLDTGIDPEHPDLVHQLDLTYGVRFFGTTYDSDFSDGHGHGTHVAGTIGAIANNGRGGTGVMWDVDILPVKVLGNTATGSFWTVSKGVLYAAGLLAEPHNPYPAQVINLSLGSSTSDQTLQDAVAQAVDSGAILVAAAGNIKEGEPREGRIMYPAAYPGVIAVGAVDYNYGDVPKLAWYSAYGDGLDFVAPGGDKYVDSDGDGHKDMVYSTMPNGSYGFMQGTSMAAPHVSGVIGLMLAAGIPPERVVDVLRRTSIPLGPEEYSPEYGWGLINAHWAVNEVETVAVIVGTREGNTIRPAAQTEIGLGGGSFILERVPAGEYQVFAWLDVAQDGWEVEPGDCFAESLPFHFEPDVEYEVSGFITEVGTVPLTGGGASLMISARK